LYRSGLRSLRVTIGVAAAESMRISLFETTVMR
jgi:hypothetical protein